MAVKKMFLPVTIFFLLLLLGLTIYSVPLSEKTEVITWTVTTEFVEPKTIQTTSYITSTVKEFSTFTSQTVSERVETVLDRGYRAIPTGNEFSYYPIKGLELGDKINVSVSYPYKTWVKLVNPDGQSVIDVIYEGGDLTESIEVDPEGVYTLWVDTLFSPGIAILRVKIEIIHSISHTQIASHTIEKEEILPKPETIVIRSTQTQTSTSYQLTTTRTTLPSREILSPLLIIIGLIIMVAGLFYGRTKVRTRAKVYCINCRAPLSPENKYCERCGASQGT
ncbi:hypothetical protein [[Eubacterium] cellulosolvens]